MRSFCRALPAEIDRPLPAAMERLTPPRAAASGRVPEATIRRLADLAALVERRSPLGKCLRRSLIRYHFLRGGGVPVRVHFGARMLRAPDGEQKRLTAHAWLSLDGEPYHEAPEDVRGYRTVAVWPDDATRD